MATEDRHFTHSTLRERIVEHVFVGDVLRTLWRLGVTDVEILRPEFDARVEGWRVSAGDPQRTAKEPEVSMPLRLWRSSISKSYAW